MILATRNLHKTREIAAILGLACLSLEDLPGAPPLREDGATFDENAAAKALQLARWLTSPRATPPRLADLPADDPAGRLLVLADDKGFFPPSNLALAVRQERLEDYPELENLLERMIALVDEESLATLERQVAGHAMEREDAVRAFLRRGEVLP